MISEGSCDTEDWSNDTEKSALHHRNKLHFKLHIKIEKKIFDIAIIYHNITVFTEFFDQIHVMLVKLLKSTLCVCVCVVPGIHHVMGPNVPTSIVIPVNFDHVGTFFRSP